MRPRALLLSAFALSLLISSPITAQAQPAGQPAGPSDAVKEVARQRYTEGVKAFDAGRFEEARLAFSQAHQLTGSPGILLNLGLAELRANRPVEGGNHLFQFLREYKEATPEQKASAIQAIEDAKKKAGLVAITVDVAGADISVDGALVGKSPLADPVFVQEGSRTIVATSAGKNAMAKVDAKKGQIAQANVVFNAAPTPTPTPAPGPEPAPVGPAPGPAPAPGPQTGPFVGYPQPGPQPDRGGGKDFGDWFLTNPIAWTGVGLTAVGLGLGIGFSAAAAGSADDADTIATAIRDRARADGLEGKPCGAEDGNGSGDAYRGPCNQLRDALGVHDANVAVAVVGWVLAGLAAGGTTAYILIEYPKAQKGTAKGDGVHVGVVPWVSEETQGAFVTGMF